MKFDIAPKVVKFKNGQFGIRRWSLSILKYQYLGIGQDCWWSTPEYVARYAAADEPAVRGRLIVYLNGPDKQIPGIDKGTPV